MTENDFLKAQLNRVNIDWKVGYNITTTGDEETLESFTRTLSNFVDNIGGDYIEESGVYCFYINTNSDEGNSSIYIGKTEGQTFKERIPQVNGHEEGYQKIIDDYVGVEIQLMLGVLNNESKIDDVEKCLIYDNQPTCNTNHKDNCNCEKHLSIMNNGEHSSVEVLNGVDVCLPSK